MPVFRAVMKAHLNSRDWPFARNESADGALDFAFVRMHGGAVFDGERFFVQDADRIKMRRCFSSGKGVLMVAPFEGKSHSQFRIKASVFLPEKVGINTGGRVFPSCVRKNFPASWQKTGKNKIFYEQRKDESL